MEEIKLSNSDDKGWLEKIKDMIYENWQTILVALIVLIVGISAYNHSQNSKEVNSEIITEENQEEIINEEEEMIAEEVDEENAKVEDEEVITEEIQEEVIEEEIVEEEVIEEEKIETIEVEKNEIEESGEGYEVTAAKGEGITHLARKAVNQYLETNQDNSITDLHKIYIEDYLQNKKGNQSIEIGHKEFFSQSLIIEAINSSKQLSEKSLENLKKYSK